MAINFNTGPYYDDFDPANNFYRVLFKPGYAVQARELNQLQSILQHQISSTANHIFKKNAVVIPGGVSLSNSANIVSITGIEDPSVLVGKTITNASSFDYTDDTTLDGYITAVVLGYRLATDTEPAALYVKYFKTQTDGRQTFNQSESLKTVDVSLIAFSVDSTIGSTIGKVATISAGTFYTKETFVDAAQQSLIVEVDNSVTTNCNIGLVVAESVVTSDDDVALLDNANGSPNQYAPGADRYKIELILARVDVNTVIDDEKFIKMMTIENNVVTFVNNNTQYAELMKMIARRTYDANGNFIVRGLDTSVTESPDDKFVWANVTGGKCYLGGYEYDQLVTTPIAIDKPRDAAHQLQLAPVTKYTADMTYFYVAGGAQAKEIPVEDSLVQLLNAAPGTSSVSVIGYAIFKDMQFAFGTTGSTDVYKMFFDYISLEKGYSISDVGGIKNINGEGAPVLHELSLSNVIGTFTTGNTIKSATNSSQTGLMYNVVNNKAYVIKNTLNDVPNTDTVKDNTTSATATRKSTFISNYSTASIPMLELDADPIKTLYNSSGTNTTSYSIIRKDEFTSVVQGNLSVTLSGSDVFEDYSTSDYFAYITSAGYEAFVDLTGLLVISDAGKKYTLTVGAGSPMIGRTIWVYSTVNKANVAEADKTAVTVTSGITIPTPSKSWMALGHQDVTKVTKVVAGKTFGISTATWATNIVTITAAENHGIAVGDVVVVSGIVSSNNTTGAFNAGYNRKFTVASKTDTAFTASLTSNPGTTSSVTNGVLAVKPDINNDVDVTSRYTLDSGNTPYLSGTGMIKLNKGVTEPQGQIAVQYIYNTIGTGNYISVDSYGDYTASDLSYIGDIKNIRQNGREIETRRYLDFRTRPSNYFFKNIGTIANGSATLVLRDLNLSYYASTLEGKYVVGPSHINGATIAVGGVVFNKVTGNTEITLSSTAGAAYTGIFYIGLYTSSLRLIDASAGAKAFEMPKDSTRLSYQYVKFLPKHVMVYVKRTGDLLSVDYKEVSSRTDAALYQRDEFKLPLAYAYMKPYTVNLRDITLEKFENPVYQMLDIHNLKRRIDRTEVSLFTNTANFHKEIQGAQNELLTIANERDIWAEDFMDITVQDYYSDDFACTIYDKSYVAPGVVTRTLSLEQDTTLNTSTWQRSGSNITLPFVEVRAFGSSSASRTNNLNPFNAINWTGKLVLNPSVDNWVDTVSIPSNTLNNTVNTSTSSTASTAATSTASTITVATTPPSNIVITLPPVVIPQPPVEELVTEINNLRTMWGPDSAGGYHAITFDWKTNTGRTGRVNTDMHISSAVGNAGLDGYSGAYAKSLINKRYNDPGVKEYLNAGTHFDQKPPSQW